MLKSKWQITLRRDLRTALLSHREIILEGQSFVISPSVVIYAAIGDLFCRLLQKDSWVLSFTIVKHSWFSVLIKRGKRMREAIAGDMCTTDSNTVGVFFAWALHPVCIGDLLAEAEGKTLKFLNSILTRNGFASLKSLVAVEVWSL